MKKAFQYINEWEKEKEYIINIHSTIITLPWKRWNSNKLKVFEYRNGL